MSVPWRRRARRATSARQHTGSIEAWVWTLPFGSFALLWKRDSPQVENHDPEHRPLLGRKS